MNRYRQKNRQTTTMPYYGAVKYSSPRHVTPFLYARSTFRLYVTIPRHYDFAAMRITGRSRRSTADVITRRARHDIYATPPFAITSDIHIRLLSLSRKHRRPRRFLRHHTPARITEISSAIDADSAFTEIIDIEIWHREQKSARPPT